MARDDTAIGFVETRGLVAALEAADAMLKASDVKLLAREQTDAALITIQVTGEVAAVQAAVDAGRRAAERVGEVVSTLVIPRPDDAVRAMQAGQLPPEKPKGKVKPPAGQSSRDRSLGNPLPEAGPPPERATRSLHEDLTVRELRALARSTPDFPLQGREIAKASKDDLLKHFGDG
jgi:ethanolamine utilization protein EutM